MNYIVCNNHKIEDIDFAISPEEQEKGLMFESSPRILVFLYKAPEIRKFWMKNCNFPLDIAFIRDNKIISIIKGLPNSEDLLGPDQKTNYVIEFPESYCKDNDIKEGDQISLKLNADILKQLFKTS